MKKKKFNKYEFKQNKNENNKKKKQTKSKRKDIHVTDFIIIDYTNIRSKKVYIR